MKEPNLKPTPILRKLPPAAVMTPGTPEISTGTTPGAADGALAHELTAYGHTLRQVFRDGLVAIYERSQPGQLPHEFELIVIREQKETILQDGSRLPASEFYPGSESWGKRGWSFPLRQRELVFELARRMVKSPCSYAGWMRATLSHWKDQGQLPNLEEHAALVAANPKRPDPIIENEAP
jgi:hypothetical protein